MGEAGRPLMSPTVMLLGGRIGMHMYAYVCTSTSNGHILAEQENKEFLVSTGNLP
jgi:hypothetical protein